MVHLADEQEQHIEVSLWATRSLISGNSKSTLKIFFGENYFRSFCNALGTYNLNFEVLAHCNKFLF